MTQISSDDVQYLAQLSSLQLSGEEIEALRTDINNIVHYVDKLAELDTDNVEPTYQVTSLSNVWRSDDVVASPVAKEALLALTAETVKGSVKVPKVL